MPLRNQAKSVHGAYRDDSVVKVSRLKDMLDRETDSLEVEIDRIYDLPRDEIISVLTDANDFLYKITRKN